MKIKFNLYERVAGLFVVTAVGMAVVATVFIGIKKGWFEPKIKLRTFVENADGLHPGTVVQLAGLQIGSVDEVDLQPGQKVEITFKIIKRYSKQIRSDSRVRVLRPFIIGEKVLELTTGTPKAPALEDGQALMAEYAPDFLEFLGGNKLGAYMQSLDSTMQNLQKLAEAFFSDQRSDEIIKLFDKMLPLMDQLNIMAREVGKLSLTLNEKRKLERTVDEVLILSQGLNKTVPMLNRDMPTLSKNVIKLTENLNKLTDDFNEMIPVVKEIAPEFPDASKAMIQALNETVITLKAMQKTIFLRGSVREVLEEEAERKPANSQ